MTFFIFCLVSSTLIAAEPPVPWKAGEKFDFNITVGFIAAGTASLEVRDFVEHEVSSGNVRKDYRSFRLVATATSNAFVDVFFKVRDRNESWLDAEGLFTHRFEQHNHEGKYHLDQTVAYDWIDRRWKQTDLVKGREPKFEEGDLPIPVVDTLSALWLVRAHELKVGEDFSLDVHSGKIYPLVVKVLKRETVKVPAGSFDCFMVEPFLKEKGIFIQKGKKLQVWLTADDRRMPVKMKAEIFIGHVHAELAETPQ
ncbi:MAG: hypothetical protein A3A86_03655 [Elusimicrobia bacterium RIFCSPLOWO2_01_FULL_60_11]|nr:MAG: hypothetical protein A3A86_03655 [Elusimicrobia bacterium RIFCSPLOWO2_01_FULL_60_11]